MAEKLGARIIAAVKERIAKGLYRPGDRLPSTRVLASEWGASRTTVTAAYAQLLAEGYLVTRRGARAVVAPGASAPARPISLSVEPAPPLSGFAQRLLGLPVPAAEEAARIADFRYGDLAGNDFPALAWRRAWNAATLRRPPRLRYGDPQGTAVLRKALQAYLWRARSIRCSAEQIVVVNGSQQGLDLSARLLLDPGDPVAMENPGYPLARQAFVAAGGAVLPIPVDSEGMVTHALPDARLAYVTPSHQFPLGAVLSVSRRRSLTDWAMDGGAVVIEDDYDSEYRHDVAPIPPVQTLAPQAVIYVGTLSKTLSPALRLGYLVVPEAFLPAFRAAKRLTDRHSSQMEQEALADFIADGAYERHVRSIRRRNAERRATLLESLARQLGPAAVVEGAATGLHVVVWLPHLAAEQEQSVASMARTAGIGLYPIAPLYDPSASRPGRAGFVLGYAGLDCTAIERGVKVLAAALAGYR